MRKLVNKRGSAHFEMIISFIFFVGFVSFLFVTLKPTDSHVLPNTVVSGLHDSFEQETYTNLSTVFLKIDDAIALGCSKIRFKLPEELFNYKIIENRVYVTDLNDNSIDSSIDAVNWELVIRNNNDESFRIAFSPEFEHSNTINIHGPCSNLNQGNGDYEIGEVTERQVISYNKSAEMKNEYYSNYDVLKEKLKIPPMFDFAIKFETLSELNMNKSILASVDVMVEDYVFGILNSTGSLINERVSFAIW
jgi:hypothetical protein